MYIALSTQRISLPKSDACAAFSVESKTVFQGGRSPWKAVISPAALSLQHFPAVPGHDAAVWVDDQPWTDADGVVGSLITLYFGTDAALTREELSALGEPVMKANMGWSPDGIHPRSSGSFPCMAMWRDELHQIWLHDAHERPCCLSLKPMGHRVRRADTLFDDATVRDFVPHISHAVARFDGADSAAVHHKLQLKMAFALQTAERVVEADGVVDDDEVAFLARTFPEEEVKRLWLDDVALRDTLARQAGEELKELLGYHEKLALLSTFFAACYSDGKLEVRELRVLKEASATLGLKSEDVVTYLQKLW